MEVMDAIEHMYKRDTIGIPPIDVQRRFEVWASTLFDAAGGLQLIAAQIKGKTV